MIIYQDMNDEINVFDSDLSNALNESDSLLEIAVDIVVNGYQGVIIHSKRLATGEYFVGINFRVDTPEGKVFSNIQTDFYQGLVIPSSRAVLKKIRRAYEQQPTL